jgi:hypothetical protein
MLSNPQHPQNYSTMLSHFQNCFQFLSNPQHSQNFISPSSSWPFVPFVDHETPHHG